MILEPLIQVPRLYLRVAKQVASYISSGELKPGDQLPSERDLAKTFNVSRPTIREAMIALELSGLIQVRTGSGVYITHTKPELSLADKGIGPFEVLELRRLVEPGACALAAERMKKTQLAKLKRILAAMKKRSNKPSLQQSDKEFHILIAESTENAAIAATVNWLWELREHSELNRVFHARILEEGIFPNVDQHERVLKALAKGDAVLAQQAMFDHLDHAIEMAATYFERYDEGSTVENS